MKSFILPKYYESKLITEIKNIRTKKEKRNEYGATKLSIGSLNFYIPKYFGFCFGVKNAIEICYKTIKENPNKKIYLIKMEFYFYKKVLVELSYLGKKSKKMIL